MRVGQSTEDVLTGDGVPHVGEFVMDNQGNFVEVIKRTASQLDNPLLMSCSEEDENLEEANNVKQKGGGGHASSIQTHNLGGRSSQI